MASILPAPQIQFIDQNGEPLIGGKVYTYEAGTTVPKLSWKDYEKTQENTNPVILDDAGRAAIWIEGSYKIIVNDANDVLIYTSDNVNSFDFELGGLTATIPDLNSTSTTAVYISTNYTTIVEDRGKNLLVDALSNPIEINLLEADVAGNKYKITIKKIDTSYNFVIIKLHGLEKIDGIEGDYNLYSYNDFIEILSDGFNWKIVASKITGATEGYNNPAIHLEVVYLDNYKLINCDTTSGDIIVDLPSVVDIGSGFNVSIKKIDDSINKVFILPFSGQKIDDEVSLNLNFFMEGATLKAGAVGWYAISQIKGRSTFTTGDVKATYKSAEEGWLLMNDETIGSSASTAFYNSDVLKDLYITLYENVLDDWCPVEGGRSGNPIIDFEANLRMTLPRILGSALCCSGDSDHYTSRKAGEYVGEEQTVLTRQQVATHDHTYAFPHLLPWRHGTDIGSTTNYYAYKDGSPPTKDKLTKLTGQGLPFNNMQPSAFMRFLIKI